MGIFDVPEGPWAPVSGVGGRGGKKFLAFKGNDGKLVIGLTVTWNLRYLRGIRLKYSDATLSEQIGVSHSSYSRHFEFEPGEAITSASLWGNGVGTRAGRIRFETNKNHTFDAGKDTSGQDEYSIEVGSGFLAGFSGRADRDIDLLAFIFLEPVMSVDIKDVVYKLPVAHKTISPFALGHGSWTNDTDKPMQWKFENSVKRTNKVEWGDTISTEYGVHANIEASIPMIAKGSEGYDWKTGHTRSWGKSTSWEVGLSWGESGTLDPGKSLTATAECQLSEGDVKYTSHVTITTVSGKKLDYNESSVMYTAQYAFTAIRVRDGSGGSELALGGKQMGLTLVQNDGLHQEGKVDVSDWMEPDGRDGIRWKTGNHTIRFMVFILFIAFFLFSQWWIHRVII